MRLYNLFFIILGSISMILGIIGIILPVLPTTPFLILASYCFVKGSPKFNSWFIETKIYKNYAEDFVKNKSMTLARKVKLMIISDLMLLFPFISIKIIYLRILIIFIVFFKYYYFFCRIKTS